MRILQHSETQLTLQYRPFSALAYSLFFAGLAIVMPFQMGPNPDLGGVFLYVLFMLGAAVGGLFFADWVTCAADLSREMVTIRRKGVFRDRKMRCQLSQVKGVEIHRRRHKSWYYYKIRLLLHSGKSVPLMSNTSMSEGNTREMAHKLGRFLNKPVSENHFGILGFGYFKELFSEIR